MNEEAFNNDSNEFRQDSAIEHGEDRVLISDEVLYVDEESHGDQAEVQPDSDHVTDPMTIEESPDESVSAVSQSVSADQTVVDTVDEIVPVLVDPNLTEAEAEIETEKPHEGSGSTATQARVNLPVVAPKSTVDVAVEGLPGPSPTAPGPTDDGEQECSPVCAYGPDDVVVPQSEVTMVYALPGEWDKILEQLQAVLTSTGRFYTSDSKITAVRASGTHGQVEVHEVDHFDVRLALSRAVAWMNPAKTEEGWRKANVPERFCRDLLKVPEHAGLRKLRGVAHQPFLRADGTLCVTAGYDAASQTYGGFDAAKFEVPTAPGRDDALAAKERLLALIDEFPFVDQELGRASVLAAMLTAVARPALTTAPMWVVTAPAAGTGKSLLCELIASFASPVPARTLALPSGEKEFNKVFVAALRRRPPVVFFDNASIDIPSYDQLCSALTSDVGEDRELGTSRMIEFSTRTLVLATGNNIRPARDMARRCVPIALDARTEDVTARKFSKPDLLQQVRWARERHVSDALTIILAWRAAADKAGMPEPLGSFVDWSRWCREAVIWLGMRDPVDATKAAMAKDDDKQLLAALLQAWHGHFGEAIVTTAQLVEHARREVSASLRPLLIEMSGEDDFNNRKIGRWLLRHEDSRAAGFVLRVVEKSGHSKSWKVAVSGA